MSGRIFSLYLWIFGVSWDKSNVFPLLYKFQDFSYSSIVEMFKFLEEGDWRGGSYTEGLSSKTAETELSEIKSICNSLSNLLLSEGCYTEDFFFQNQFGIQTFSSSPYFILNIRFGIWIGSVFIFGGLTDQGFFDLSISFFFNFIMFISFSFILIWNLKSLMSCSTWDILSSTSTILSCIKSSFFFLTSF